MVDLEEKWFATQIMRTLKISEITEIVGKMYKELHFLKAVELANFKKESLNVVMQSMQIPTVKNIQCCIIFSNIL